LPDTLNTGMLVDRFTTPAPASVSADPEVILNPYAGAPASNCRAPTVEVVL